MRQCLIGLLVYRLQSHLLQIRMILLTSSKFHLFWAEPELQSGPHNTGRRGACGLTVGHPEGLSSAHATHAYVHPHCFPAPLGHSSQQVSLGKVRPQMSDRIKRKSVWSRDGPKNISRLYLWQHEFHLPQFPRDTQSKITSEVKI